MPDKKGQLITADILTDELSKPEHREYLLGIMNALLEGDSDKIRVAYDYFFSYYGKLYADKHR